MFADIKLDHRQARRIARYSVAANWQIRLLWRGMPLAMRQYDRAIRKKYGGCKLY